MKKLVTTFQYKKSNSVNAESQFKKRLKHRDWLRAKRFLKQGKSRKVIQIERENKLTFTIIPPSNFSFVNNTDEVLAFMQEIKKYTAIKKQILINFKNVTHLSNDALVLLICFVRNKLENNRCRIQGNFPRNHELRTILEESGLFGSKSKNQEDFRNYIITRNNKRADGKIADELIKRASKVVFGESGRCLGVYKALMECMANTCYHAKPKKTGYETWWLSVYHNKVDNCVSFAFIDSGVGIFKSTKMNDLKLKIASMFNLYDNVDIFKEILSGHQMSSTKLPYRGKGLPAIYKGLERNYYSNLKIISNDVSADLSNFTFAKLNNDFSGTFLYWELKNDNRWIK